MRASTRALLTAGAAACLGACTSSTPSTSTGAGVAIHTGFQVQGDPESASGATWSYRGRRGTVHYDLQGVLFKPPGPGPFPAVILSHGANGNAAMYARRLAPEMVGWGLVCIATNYTHAEGVPIGAPGGLDERGASRANLLRAETTHELLRTLSYVDMTRVAAHGHSMGAYVTAVLVSANPTDFRVASQTGGGVRPSRFVGGPAPSESEVRGIRVPYQIHHGELDAVVPLDYAKRFASILAAQRVPHELYVYPGANHLEPSRSPLMLERVHTWYAAHGMF
jgi:dienelactone hydrolase